MLKPERLPMLKLKPQRVPLLNGQPLTLLASQ
jgi:hypothetical protein